MLKNNDVALSNMCSKIQNEYRRVPGKQKRLLKCNDVVIFVVQELLVSPFSDLRFVSKEVSEPQVVFDEVKMPQSMRKQNQ